MDASIIATDKIAYEFLYNINNIIEVIMPNSIPHIMNNIFFLLVFLFANINDIGSNNIDNPSKPTKIYIEIFMGLFRTLPSPPPHAYA